MATLRHNKANLISVPLTVVSLSIKKMIYPKNLFFSVVERFSPGVVVDVDRKSKIRFGKRVSIHSRCRIASTNGGILYIGEHTSFNVGCIVTCRNKITIGSGVSFAPNVMMYDHDHMIHPEHGVNKTDYELGEIEIGDNTWIGAGVIILKGTRIGKNCVIAAGSVVKGNIPDGTILIQKRTNTYKGVE